MRKVTHKPFFGIVKILSIVVAATVLSVATGIFAFADDEAACYIEVFPNLAGAF